MNTHLGTNTKVTRALISVSDKTGVLEFCRSLHSLNIELLSRRHR